MNVLAARDFDFDYMSLFGELFLVCKVILIASPGARKNLVILWN